MSNVRFLALGDSYTIGESVAEQDRWPNQLAAMLESQGRRTDVTIIARTGWTVNELWQGIEAGPPEGTYDLVTLLIGVNDQYRGYRQEDYRQDFRFMLGMAIEYAGEDSNKVIVLSIPDWGITPFAAGKDSTAIARQIDEFNAINQQETRFAGAHYVNVTDISRMAKDDPQLTAGDGLHPSARMYRMWAEKVWLLTRDILK